MFAKLRARLEVRKLEDRYVRRNNRSTFTSGATYIDGEYVFPGVDYPREVGSKLSKLSLASLSSSTSNTSSKSRPWKYRGPMASVGNWSR